VRAEGETVASGEFDDHAAPGAVLDELVGVCDLAEGQTLDDP
jgi:hypothetical protein